MMQNENCLSLGKLQLVWSKTTCCNRNCNLYGRKGLPVLCVQVTACIYQYLNFLETQEMSIVEIPSGAASLYRLLQIQLFDALTATTFDLEC